MASNTNGYEYECSSCDWQGHFLDFAGADDKLRCPQCGSSEIDSLAPDSESD